MTSSVAAEALGTVPTVAGNGNDDLGGDVDPAIAAMLSVRKDVTVDAKIDIISALIGTGKEGFKGDGVPAMEALLSDPWSMAVNGQGNLIFAERSKHRTSIVRPEM